jgi:hypothetical protein
MAVLKIFIVKYAASFITDFFYNLVKIAISIMKATIVSGAADHLVKVQLPADSGKSTQKTDLIFVIDSSGSMYGTPRDQVLKVIESFAQKGMKFRVINFSSNAIVCSAEELRAKWFGQGTEFCPAFSLAKTMVECNPTHNKVFVFLTDGQAGDDPLSNGNPRSYYYRGNQGTTLPELKNFFHKHAAQTKTNIVVHCFGLGSAHDLNLLTKISEAGTIPGEYNYASSKSADEIMTQLSAMISFASMSREIPIILNGKKYTLTAFLQENVLSGELWSTQKPTSIEYKGTSLELEYEEGSFEYQLANLRHRLFECVTTSNAITTVEEIQKQLDKFKTMKMKRMERIAKMEPIETLQADVDNIRSILTEKTRSSISKNELAAKMKAMSFQGKMGKARHGRTMDQRLQKNQELLLKMEQALEDLPLPSAEETQGLDPDLRDDIGQATASELMEDSKTDILVMGTRNQRSPVVIDQPVCIQVEQCHTSISLESFQTAVDFKIRHSNANATGTFDPSEVTEVISGLGRESINSFLPLYVCETHYQRIRLLLPVILGLFFTLSESGYHPKQLPALFAILARLHRQAKTDRHRFMVDQFKQVCSRLMEDTALMNELRVPTEYRPHTIIERFCQDINSHQKSELPTLDILYGCLLASEKPLPDNLSPILMAEIVRRHYNFRMMDNKDRNNFYEVLSKILDVNAKDISLLIYPEDHKILDDTTKDISLLIASEDLKSFYASFRKFLNGTFSPAGDVSLLIDNEKRKNFYAYLHKILDGNGGNIILLTEQGTCKIIDSGDLKNFYAFLRKILNGTFYPAGDVSLLTDDGERKNFYAYLHKILDGNDGNINLLTEQRDRKNFYASLLKILDKTSQSSVGRDNFHTSLRKILYGKSYPAGEISLLTDPKVVQENGQWVFHPPTFKEYVSLTPLTREAMLEQSTVTTDVTKFNETFNAVGFKMEQEQYLQCLIPSVIQGLYACHNDAFREVIDQNLFILDPLNQEQFGRLTDHIVQYFDRKRREHWKSQVDKQETEFMAAHLIYTMDNMNLIVAVFRTINRGQKIWSLLVEYMFPDGEYYEGIPLYDQKLALMLTARYQKETIFEGGPWMAGKHYGALIRKRFENTPYKTIISELDSLELKHQYRSSDKPNRHTHCNSNPLWEDKPDNESVPRLISKWDY